MAAPAPDPSEKGADTQEVLVQSSWVPAALLAGLVARLLDRHTDGCSLTVLRGSEGSSLGWVGWDI